jgi:HD-like signal output (HDOD) protein
MQLELVAPDPLTPAQLALATQLTAALTQAEDASDAIPSGLPTASLRILNLVARAEIELSDLASAVQQDPALTAAVLRVANSAAMGAMAGPIRTVREAITRLGVTESARVAGVVAAQTLFSPQSKLAQSLFGARLSELHVAAATIAGGAAQLSMERRTGRSDLAYLGGMLHEVGKTLALGGLSRLIQRGEAPKELDPAVLDAVLDAVHVTLGSRAHRSWELPDYLVTLCDTQAEPALPHEAEHAEQHLVRVVSGLYALRSRPLPRERLACLVDSVQALALTPVQARALDTSLRARAQQVRQILA